MIMKASERKNIRDKKPFQNYEAALPMLVAIDSIIFSVSQNKLQVLIFKREVEPLAGEWSLIGSFVGDRESVDQAAERVLFELTGLQNIFMKQLHCFGRIERDPGARVLSIAYWSLIKANIADQHFTFNDHQCRWVAIEKLPELVLDHADMVAMAVHNLQERARFYPVGFELLPKTFTLPQLFQVYQAIFSQSIDDRNFRKKILKSGLLIKTGFKDKSTSKKGSFLYQFDQKRYNHLSESGYNFEM